MVLEPDTPNPTDRALTCQQRLHESQLEIAISGQGVRRIAAALGRPETTVREWCRRFRATADVLARALLAAAVRSGWTGFDLPTAAGPATSHCAPRTPPSLAVTDRSGPCPSRPLVSGGAWLGPNTTSPLAPSRAFPVMAGAPVLAGDPLHVTPAEALALWQYHLVVEALDPRLSGMERGALVRRIAGEHTAPSGEPRQLSRKTLDRWIRRCRAEGFAGHRRCRLQTGPPCRP